FGGGRSIEGSGIALGLNQGSVTAKNYTKMKEDGGWFSNDKTWTNFTSNSDAQAAVQSAVDSIKSTINRSVVAMSTSIDMSLVKIAETQISTAGRKAEDINKDLEAWLVSAANEMAKNVTGLREFAFYGENAFDALVRLST
ncbi:hypothetical protein KI809_20440, partial [Geobacter pelophilus]